MSGKTLESADGSQRPLQAWLPTPYEPFFFS